MNDSFVSRPNVYRLIDVIFLPEYYFKIRGLVLLTYAIDGDTASPDFKPLITNYVNGTRKLSWDNYCATSYSLDYKLLRRKASLFMRSDSVLLDRDKRTQQIIANSIILWCGQLSGSNFTIDGGLAAAALLD